MCIRDRGALDLRQRVVESLGAICFSHLRHPFASGGSSTQSSWSVKTLEGSSDSHDLRREAVDTLALVPSCGQT